MANVGQSEDVRSIISSLIPTYIGMKIDESMRDISEEQYVTVYLDDFLMWVVRVWQDSCCAEIPKSLLQTSNETVQQDFSKFCSAEDIMSEMTDYLRNLIDRKKRCRYKNVNYTISRRNIHQNRVFWEKY